MDQEGIIKFQPEITRDYVLSKVSEEEIFERWGIPVVDYPFCSPLRRDRHPSCYFYRRRRDNRLIMHDHAGFFWGDCFDLVMLKTGLKFYDALRHILETMDVTPDRTPAPSRVIISPLQCEIRVKRMQWTQAHIDYWNSYHISVETCQHFHIAPIERAWINGVQVFSYEANHETAFCYWFGSYDYKLYFPTRGKGEMRFAQNNANIVQGYTQLPETGDGIVITKSLKDVAALYEVGVTAIAPMSETQIISEVLQEDLFHRFHKLFCLYDLDKTGINSMKAMRQRGIIPLWLPRSQPKDFSDLMKKIGKKDARTLCEYVRDMYY